MVHMVRFNCKKKPTPLLRVFCFSDPSVRALGIIVVISGVVGFLMLNRGHDWGDDFAAYILQAQALVRGDASNDA